MRKFLLVAVFIASLSLPAFGGHTVPGAWCECGSSPACICDPDEVPPQGLTAESSDLRTDEDQDTAGPETLFVLLAFAIALRWARF